MSLTGTADPTDLHVRLRRLEDESAIQRLLMSYGPAADSGQSTFAAGLWLEDGEYDWDANGEPHRGSAAVDSMLQTSGHRQLMAEGVAHFGGPLLVEVDDDRATAVNYSLIMRRDGQRFYLWRVERGAVGLGAIRLDVASAAPHEPSSRRDRRRPGTFW